jgi:isochorismate pyruvate lyase
VAARKGKAKSVKRQAKRKTPKSAKRKAPAPRRRADQSRYSSLHELRRAIDAVDRAIVPLLCQRLLLVRTAAHFKSSHEGVVVQSRVEEIIDRVRALSRTLGCNPDTLEAVYRAVIDEFTLEEQRNWRLLNEPKG